MDNVDLEVAKLKERVRKALHPDKIPAPLACSVCGEPLYKHVTPCTPQGKQPTKSQRELEQAWLQQRKSSGGPQYGKEHK